METKLFEIRDRGTFFAVMATKMEDDNYYERFLLNHHGYSRNADLITMKHISVSQTRALVYPENIGWGDRTYQTAHKYIYENWEELESGDVVDVEHILGETSKPSKRLRIVTGKPTP